MTELIHSVASVFGSDDANVLNDKYQFYYVPAYQRGYKWTKSQIEKLLVDINNFEYQSGKFYCVQNITLVPNEANSCYNVVDGQQRLTTMTLILSALKQNSIVRDKLKFPNNSIRKHTNIFLRDYIIERTELLNGWDSLCKVNEDFDHQDIYHLYNGYQIINAWLDTNGIDRNKFCNKLLNHVKFICNIIEGEKEEKIFGNLNSKRVYLDGADLVRAILITRVTKEKAKDETIKNIVRINERRVRLGWELDQIAQWWNRREIIDYFKPFIQLETDGDVHFDVGKYPINQLVSLYADSKEWDALSLEAIENEENSVKLYNELLSLHNELVDWYSNKEIYHYLGFLFHQSNNKNRPKFKDLLKYWRIECTQKQDFSNYLIGLVKTILFDDEQLDQLFKAKQNWYADSRLAPILLFLDIIEALKDNRNRLHVEAFLKKEQDIEHIHPQKPKAEKDKLSYLQYLIDSNSVLANDERVKGKNVSSLRDNVINQIIDEFQVSVDTNSIGNLVLLYAGLNRSIQNKSYTYKRKRVLAHYNEGFYIQPHTLKVFSRYFQDPDSLNNDNNFWTQLDVQENTKHIEKTLVEFFLKNTLANGI